MEKLPKRGGSRSKSNPKVTKTKASPRTPAKDAMELHDTPLNASQMQAWWQNMTPAQLQEVQQMLQGLTQKQPVEEAVEKIDEEVNASPKAATKKPRKSPSKSKAIDASAPPKKVSNPYMCFLKANHAKLKEQNADLGATQMFALVGETWREMTDEQKYPYILQSEKDKLRFNEQMQEYEEKGYFTLADGSKSTDVSSPGEAIQDLPKKAEKSAVSTLPSPKKKSNQVEANSLTATDANSTMTTQSTLSAKSQHQKKATSKKVSKGAEIEHESVEVMDAPAKNSQKRQRRD